MYDRSRRVGASDVSPILGWSKWATPWDVWDRKHNGTIVTTGEAAEWGKRLEASIFNAYKEKVGRKGVALFDDPVTHPADKWKVCSPDGLVLPDKRNKEKVLLPRLPDKPGGQTDPISVMAGFYGVDAKVTGYLDPDFGAEWTGEFPLHHLGQLVWSCHVCDTHQWDLAVLVRGTELKCYRYTRDLELEALVVERVEKFYRDHLLTGRPPELDGEQRLEVASRVQEEEEAAPPRPATQDEVDLVDSLLLVDESIAALDADTKKAKLVRSDIVARLLESAGNVRGLSLANGYLDIPVQKGRTSVSWKAVAESVAMHLDGAAYTALVKENTKVGTPSRSLKWKEE